MEQVRMTTTASKPRAIDCFSGCGGMTVGLKRAGFSVVGAVEIDPVACDVYELNHPDTKLWRKDICELTCDEILTELNLRPGELDLLGGCPPCQGFSTLRTHNGKKRIRDERNDLIFQFQRLILGLLPKSVMLENVPGLFRNRRLSEFKKSLKEHGYAVIAKILNVADYGVPQRRRRLVVLASRYGTVGFAAKAERRLTVRDAIGALPPAGESGDPLHDLKENRTPRIRKLIDAIPHDGGSRTALPRNLQLKCHRESDGFKDVYGRMSWDRLSPTITTGCFNPSKGRFLHPCENRAITMREAALLQSFPADYQFPVEFGKINIASMIGNALPPEFIYCHARQIIPSSTSFDFSSRS
jgi:DNA (cytosine-5)-methyltransferase 1